MGIALESQAAAGYETRLILQQVSVRVQRCHDRLRGSGWPAPRWQPRGIWLADWTLIHKNQRAIIKYRAGYNND
jgi:hypothetical protein